MENEEKLTDLVDSFYEMKGLNQYLMNDEHLPKFLKDFHDQKDFFKAVYEQYKDANASELFSKISWVDAHCFTIDIFLWWMGHHGYKLQKIRKKGVEFYNAKESIDYYLGKHKEKLTLNFQQ